MTTESTSTDQETETEVAEPTIRSRRKWLLRIAIVVAFPLLLPTFIALTGLHNVLLNGVLIKRDIAIVTDSASLGWFTPVSLHGVHVGRYDNRWMVSTQSITTEQSLIDLLFGYPDVGTITLEQPSVVLTHIPTTSPEQVDSTSPTSKTPELRAIIQNGSVEILVLTDPQPLIAIEGISFVARTVPHAEANLLIVEPVTLFDHRTLTPERCDRGLQLIAPVLSKSATISGELTVELDELQIPISSVTPEQRVKLTKISGRLMLHDVETGLKSPLLAKIAPVLSKLTGGRFDVIRIAEESTIDFRVENGRVHHEGLTIVIPELSKGLTIETSGWVDVDKNIDILVLVNLASVTKPKIALLAKLTAAPLEFHITGTLNKPKLSLPQGRKMVDQLKGRWKGIIGGKSGDEEQEITDVVSDFVGDLIPPSKDKPGVREKAQGILNMIKSIRGGSKKDDSSKEDQESVQE